MTLAVSGRLGIICKEACRQRGSIPRMAVCGMDVCPVSHRVSHRSTVCPLPDVHPDFTCSRDLLREKKSDRAHRG